jgi:surfeit locus 1 family protein
VRVRFTAPGVLAALLVVVVAAGCIRLGFWQLDRLEQRRARNAALAEGMARAPLVLRADTLAAVIRDPAAYHNRRVELVGVLEPAGTVVLRGRSDGGRPGVHLVAPLRIDGGDTAVLVNRGWVPSPDAASLDPRPFVAPGTRRVEGLLQTMPEPEDRGAPTRIRVAGEEVLTLRRLHLPTLQEHTTTALLPFYVQELPGARDAGPPYPVALPTLDDGPHLGYAIQWFSFAAIAVIGFGILLVRSSRSPAA